MKGFSYDMKIMLSQSIRFHEANTYAATFGANLLGDWQPGLRTVGAIDGGLTF